MDGVLLGDTNEFGRLMVPALEIRQYEFVVNRDGYKKNTLSFTPGKETGELIIVLKVSSLTLKYLPEMHMETR